MLDILGKRHMRTLAEFASSNVLLAFDFDGTLAPIVDNPSAARMRRSTRRLLGAVARSYPCVVISGRARRDALKRLGNVPVFHVAGNHGIEPWDQNADYSACARRWLCALKDRLSSCEGVELENKTYTVTVHYRNAKRRREAIAAVREAVRSFRDATLLRGKESINLVPRGARLKRAALERARRLLACDAAIYVGDDQTDDEAFAADRADRLLAIQVGPRRGSYADYGLKTQADIDAFLCALLSFRRV